MLAAVVPFVKLLPAFNTSKFVPFATVTLMAKVMALAPVAL